MKPTPAPKISKITTVSVLILVAYLGVHTLVALAAGQYQTVPTMPPPTATPTNTQAATPTTHIVITPTHPILPTPPRLSPTVTQPDLTSQPLTQTAQVMLSATITATNSSTVVPARTRTGSTLPPTLMQTLDVKSTGVGHPTSTPAAGGTSGTNMSLYGLIGGAIVLVALVLFLILSGRRRKRQVKDQYPNSK
jgi:hypothetical protein